MAPKRDDIIIRLEPEWKLLGDTLVKALVLSRNQVIADLYKGWILQKLSEITDTQYADSPDGLQAAAEALLKYRDDERAKDADSDAELLQYLTRCKEIQAERQSAELQRLNQQEEERKREEQLKELREKYRTAQKRISAILIQVISIEEMNAVHEKWLEYTKARGVLDSKEEETALHDSVLDAILSLIKNTLMNESLTSESEDNQNLKKEALSIISELKSLKIRPKDINDLAINSFFDAVHYHEHPPKEDEEEEE